MRKARIPGTPRDRAPPAILFRQGLLWRNSHSRNSSFIEEQQLVTPLYSFESNEVATLAIQQLGDICTLLIRYLRVICLTKVRKSWDICRRQESTAREEKRMATVVSPPRPDLRAYREAQALAFPELVRRLSAVLGKKLTAYIAGVNDVRAVDRWISGSESYGKAEQRLRLAYHVAAMLSEHDRDTVVQGWFSGINPELGDRVPARVLRETDPAEAGPEILKAGRAFVAGG
jgi:hypothetical protein